MDIKYKNGVLAVNRIRLLIEYSLDKTYTENLQEQPDSKMPFQIEKFGYNPSKPETLGPALKKQEETLRSYFKLNTHDWLALIEISTGLLGLIPTPLSPFLLGISLVAGVADAGLYYKEGDPYMGTMMLALSIIPGGEIVKILKGSKVLTKRGVKGSKELIKKYKSGAKLTSEELDDIAKLGTDISKNADEITKSMKNSVIRKYFADKSPKFLINSLLFLKKIGVIKAGDIALKIGGLVYGLDKLYLFTFRKSILADTEWGKEWLDSRTRNDLRASINGLLGYEKEVNEYLMTKLIESTEKLEKSGKNAFDDSLKISETPDNSFIKDAIAKLKVEKEKKRKDYEIAIKAPSTSEILSGRKVLTLNQRGESVKEIQKMLYDIGYDYLITNFETLDNWNDGIYGKSTKSAVETFQEDNQLSPDGIVGKTTLIKLNDIHRNKITDNNETK
jgi:hypothetical protein